MTEIPKQPRLNQEPASSQAEGEALAEASATAKLQALEFMTTKGHFISQRREINLGTQNIGDPNQTHAKAGTRRLKFKMPMTTAIESRFDDSTAEPEQ